MRVRMKATLSGTRDGQAWPERGGTLDLPDDEAQHLVRAGLAEQSAETEDAPVEEAEDTAPVEETATPPGEAEKATPGRRRGQAKKPGDE